MSKALVRYFIVKKSKTKEDRYYWQPKSKYRQYGWQTQRLSNRISDAINEAEMLNRRLDHWRQNKEIFHPFDDNKTIRQRPERGTLNAVIELYKSSPDFTSLRDRTKHSYEHNLRALSAWAGARLMTQFTRRNVSQFYTDHLNTPYQARALIGMLKILSKFAFEHDITPVNVIRDIKVQNPAPRQVIWTDEEIRAFVAKADTMGYRSIGTAALIGFFLAQRLTDVRALSWEQFKDGRFIIRQSKTGRLIEVPAAHELADRLAITVRDKSHDNIIISESTGQPYNENHFSRTFRTIRAACAETHPKMARVCFRDLRRTGIVRMAEAGATEAEIAAVSGHKIESTRQILETYLPRTGKMAVHAIDKLNAARAIPINTPPDNSAIVNLFKDAPRRDASTTSKPEQQRRADDPHHDEQKRAANT